MLLGKVTFWSLFCDLPKFSYLFEGHFFFLGGKLSGSSTENTDWPVMKLTDKLARADGYIQPGQLDLIYLVTSDLPSTVIQALLICWHLFILFSLLFLSYPCTSHQTFSICFCNSIPFKLVLTQIYRSCRSSWRLSGLKFLFSFWFWEVRSSVINIYIF